MVLPALSVAMATFLTSIQQMQQNAHRSDSPSYPDLWRQLAVRSSAAPTTLWLVLPILSLFLSFFLSNPALIRTVFFLPFSTDTAWPVLHCTQPVSNGAGCLSVYDTIAKCTHLLSRQELLDKMKLPFQVLYCYPLFSLLLLN